jgi:subtilase-type serine protease
LSGELHATEQSIMLRSGDAFMARALDHRLSTRQVDDGERGMWIDAFGFRGSFDGDGNASGGDYRSSGIAGGGDLTLQLGTRVGIALGYSQGNTDLDRSGAGKANLDSYHFALYGEHVTGPWQFKAAGAFSRHNVDTRRRIDYGSVSRRARADYNGDQLSAYFTAMYNMDASNGVRLAPFGTLQYSRLDRDSFRESGADSLNLDVEDETSNSLYSTLGVRANWDLHWQRTHIEPELRLGWSHQFMDRNGTMNAAFAATPSRDGYQGFQIKGVRTPRDSAVIGVGLTATTGKNSRVFLNYNGSFNRDQREHGLFAGLRISW